MNTQRVQMQLPPAGLELSMEHPTETTPLSSRIATGDLKTLLPAQ